MMHLLYRRYARSGAAPRAFYVAFALGFTALALFAMVRGNWLVVALAIVMVAVTAAGARVMRRLGGSVHADEGADHV
jgi:cobalamin synthase